MKSIQIAIAFTLLATSLQLAHAISPEAKKVLKQYEDDGLTTELLCDFDFKDGPLEALEPKLNVLKGHYEVDDGVLLGKELAEDHHAATAGLDLPLGHHAFAYFEVELHEAGNIIVTINGKGRGHVCRAVISSKFIAVQSDNKPKAVAVKQALEIESDETLEVLVELHNDTLTLTLLNVRGSEPITIQNEFINHPIDNIRWAIAKGPARIDEITVARVVSPES
mgnify:CR=1 FL=1|tara:strand:- start:413 stop:1081 length:669 start_codon:yes stop_codon:yes gene_type:complete